MNSASQSAPGYLGLANTPPLAILASIAAFIEIFIHRLALVSSFETFGAFFRNLTVITASIACSFWRPSFLSKAKPHSNIRSGIARTTRVHRHAHSPRFCFLPGSQTTSGLCFYAWRVCVHVGLVSRIGRYPAQRGWRFRRFVYPTLHHQRPCDGRDDAACDVANAFDAPERPCSESPFLGIELLYLLVLVFGAVAILMQRKPASGRFFFLFAFQFVATGGGVRYPMDSTPGTCVRHSFYDAFGLELFLASVPWAYLLPICGALSVATAGFYTLAPPMHQFSLGVALLVAAGFAPSTPAKFMVWVLALTLISRSIAARSFRAQ